MCGITGVIHFNDKTVNSETLTNMRDSMIHRGPDGGSNWISQNGQVGFAHRRLSIIDLSTSADQPMIHPENEGIVLTYNGEIYNHEILRSELTEAGCVFKTDHSDTEVLIQGYAQWGLKLLLEKLEGDYAFAIWDAEKKKISLARDRIGVKPLYFSVQKDRFLFGSEIKAIVADPIVERDIEPVAMSHYLSNMTTPAPLTMFKDIFKLPAGHILELDLDGSFTVECYWVAMPGQSGLSEEMRDIKDWKTREEMHLREITSRLTNAIEKRMMSDVPFGVFLSGGVDSSTNVALMSKFTDKPLETFSVGFADHKQFNEFDYARKIADKYNTNHHEIHITEKDMVGYLGDLIHTQDEPLADWVCVPLYFVTKLAKDNGITVVQVGEGADEQFCGYHGYMLNLEMYHKYWQPFRKYLPKFIQKAIAGLANIAAKIRPGLGTYSDIIDRAARDRENFWTGATVFWDFYKKRLINEGNFTKINLPSSVEKSGILPKGFDDIDTFNVIKHYRDTLLEQFPDSDILTRMTYAELQLRLPELLLMRVDKVTMSQSIEARVPFLDHKLVEYSMDIPMEDKIHNGVPKYLVKKAVEGLIPDDIIYRKKMGFAAPMGDWLRGDFGLQAREEMLNSAILERGFFDVDYIKNLFREHRSGKGSWETQIWVLYNLFAWYDYWIAGKSIGKAA